MRRMHQFGTLAIIGSLMLCAHANGVIIRVDHESTTNGPGTDPSWSDAFDNLQDALEYASDPENEVEEVWVADGTYVPSEATNILYPRTATFALVPGVKMLGGFQGLSRPGGGEIFANQRDPDLYETILSGEIDDPEDPYDNIFHVVTALGSSIEDETIINGFTITHSHSSEDEGGNPIDLGNVYPAAGLLIAGGAWPVVARCKITDHVGRGVFITGEPEGPVQFLSCTFVDNVAGYGGGVACVDIPATAEVKFVNCLAHRNFAATAAFVFTDASTSFINCTITENECEAAVTLAGAIRFHNEIAGTNFIANCILYGNTNGLGSGENAQIGENSADLTVRNSNIQGLDYYAGNNNMDVDPSFESPSHEQFNLQYLSLLLNNGDESDIPLDTYDIDDDGITNEPLPDRAMNSRQNNPTDCVDIGAYEEQTAGTCLGDITGSGGSPDGAVDVVDLLLIVNAWGTPGGAADITPNACGDGTVDVTDMNLVINNWGNCSSFHSEPPTIQEVIAMLLEFAAEDESLEDAVAEAIQALLN